MPLKRIQTANITFTGYQRDQRRNDGRGQKAIKISSTSSEQQAHVQSTYLFQLTWVSLTFTLAV
jgi:hypothetical protein